MSMTYAKQSHYRNAKATMANAVPDRISAVKTYKSGGECSKCGQYMAQRLWRHKARCEVLPSASEISDMMEDPTCTILKITRRYATRAKWITSILLFGDNDWTEQSLKAHGFRARVINDKATREAQRKERDSRSNGTTRKHRTVEGPRCICGILVPEEGDSCEFCVMERNGIRSYHDMASSSR